MSEIITINDSEFNLADFRSCASAIEEVEEYIEKLEKQKQADESKISSSFFDFKNAKKLRASKKNVEEELDHFRALLEKLEDKYTDTLAKEMTSKTEYEIARLEKQSATLAELCRKEIPVLCRKLAIIAAALKEHQQQVRDGVDMAECHEVEFPNMADPLQRIAGERAFASKWLKNLHLPLLDEQPDVATFWPLPDMERYAENHQDNPKMKDDVDELLSAEDMLKAAKALFTKIEKRKTVIREAEQGPYSFQDYSEPLWFERPRGEWAELLAPNPVSVCVRQLGNKIQFWLELPQQRKPGAFIHLLDPEERAQAIEKIPEDERQQYLDLLMHHACNDDFEDGSEQAESAA